MKQQSTLEFIMTYSWAILIISLFVVSVAVLSDTKSPTFYLGSSCNIQPLLPCSESLLTYNSVTPLQYYLLFSNQLGSVMYFQPNAINLTTTSLGGPASYSTGSCTPGLAGVGVTVLCITNIAGPVKPKPGTQTVLTFTLNYELCSTGSKSSCTGGIYKSSGFSTQSVAPQNIKLYNLTLITKPAAAGAPLVVNGATYFNGSTVYLMTGNDILYAAIPKGYSHVAWSINSISSTLSSLILQNTTISISSNAVVTATFT
jgi:hypothetical protein